ncbi:hypothetical protein MXMO3_01691 [Maritalea myrionectae]|uniref:Uncharacterized protein n=1 Tax=Maritalea myrionectae TaxID=454601 RepID=A0A2R4MDV9_9HYPH|nr:hypothetical protein [Maritalea myrionectae]AVX04217.1 hypothetical protein MXMO3_01691 [Maritalea myrionectae]
MTPRDRAEKIVERFLSTPEGFAPDDKQSLIAAIEQGMNEVLEDAATKLDRFLMTRTSLQVEGVVDAVRDVKSLKSNTSPRKTITDNQKDEKR